MEQEYVGGGLFAECVGLFVGSVGLFAEHIGLFSSACETIS